MINQLQKKRSLKLFQKWFNQPMWTNCSSPSKKWETSFKISEKKINDYQLRTFSYLENCMKTRRELKVGLNKQNETAWFWKINRSSCLKRNERQDILRNELMINQVKDFTGTRQKTMVLEKQVSSSILINEIKSSMKDLDPLYQPNFHLSYPKENP